MLELYKNIKSRRLELNMSQSTLAEKVGYADKGMISRIENGKVDLPQSQIEKFAAALKTTPSRLMGWEDDNSPIKPLLKTYEQRVGLSEDFGNQYIDKALEMLSLYQKASPEARKAVEVLLKFEPPQS